MRHDWKCSRISASRPVASQALLPIDELPEPQGLPSAEAAAGTSLDHYILDKIIELRKTEEVWMVDPSGSPKTGHHIRLPKAAKPLNTVSTPFMEVSVRGSSPSARASTVAPGCLSQGPPETAQALGQNQARWLNGSFPAIIPATACLSIDNRLEELFMNIGALLPRHARYRPDHLALVVGDQRLTYQRLNAVVNRLANALLANGIAKGEKIATVLPNCLELMTAYSAAAKTGIVIVPMSTLLQDHGLAALLRDSDSVVVLAEASFAQTLDRIRGELPALRADGFVLAGCQGEAPPGFRTYEDFTAGAAEDNPPDP